MDDRVASAAEQTMVDPRGARVAATAILAEARAAGDRAAEVSAHRALGLAARQLQDAGTAARHLRRAIQVAGRHRLASHRAEARMSLALVLHDLGRPAAALREVDRAVAALTGLPRARARMQRGILLRRIGREDEALDAYGAALASFRRHGDQLWQARALTNRGVLHAYRGGLANAAVDLRRAEQLYEVLRMPAAVAQVRHNLGFVAAQGGDVVQALRWYDRADEHFRRDGRPAEALIDRAELLLAARLLPEARRSAQEAIDVCVQAQLGSLLPQARLLLAQAALAAGDHSTAAEQARAARRAFQRRGQRGWIDLARYIELRATGAQTSPDRSRLRQARSVARALRDTGWAVHAMDACLYAAELALAVGTPDDIAAVLADLAESEHVVARGPARLRIRAWHAQAVVRLHAGNRPGAQRAIAAGLRLLDQYRAALGATELRILSSAEGAELAALGVRLALEHDSARQALRQAERWRAATLRLPPTPTGPAEALTADIAQLRRVGAELSAGGGDLQRRQRLARRQRALEDTVRRQTWQRDGGADQLAGGAPVPIDQIIAGLGPHALLEIVESSVAGGRLHALVAVGGQVRQRTLGPPAEVRHELAALRFAMRRLVLGHGSVASRAAAAATARHGLERLEELLWQPVRHWCDEAPLVIVPTGDLHSLPWSALPGLSGRPVVTAPSAAAWWRASTALAGHPDQPGDIVLVAASAPAHSVAEIQAIARQWPGATVLTGAAASVQSVLRALDGSAGAHLAAHGAFRADNPLFSHIRLDNGPLTMHELAGLAKPPALMVLSACDTGLSAVHPGDELMGLTSALLGAGTRTLVATIGPVDDLSSRELMSDLHRRLAAGTPVPQALAAARAQLIDQARAAAPAWVTAANFVCFGAG